MRRVSCPTVYRPDSCSRSHTGGLAVNRDHRGVDTFADRLDALLRAAGDPACGQVPAPDLRLGASLVFWLCPANGAQVVAWNTLLVLIMLAAVTALSESARLTEALSKLIAMPTVKSPTPGDGPPFGRPGVSSLSVLVRRAPAGRAVPDGIVTRLASHVGPYRVGFPIRGTRRCCSSRSLYSQEGLGVDSIFISSGRGDGACSMASRRIPSSRQFRRALQGKISIRRGSSKCSDPYPAPAALAMAPFALLPIGVAVLLFLCLSVIAIWAALAILRVSDWRCYGALHSSGSRCSERFAWGR